MAAGFVGTTSFGLAFADETPTSAPGAPEVQLAPAAVVAAGADVLDPNTVTRLTSYTRHLTEGGTAFALEDGRIVTVAHALVDARGIGLGDVDDPFLIDFDAPDAPVTTVSRLHDLASVDLSDLDSTGLFGARASLAPQVPAVGSTVVMAGIPESGRLEIVTAQVLARRDGVEFGIGRPDVLVLDQAVSTGWSGGPVVDDQGRVFAVIVAVERTSGVTLAVPIEHLPG